MEIETDLTGKGKMCPGYVDRRHLPVTQYQWILCPFLYINYNGEMSRERLGPRLELSKSQHLGPWKTH